MWVNACCLSSTNFPCLPTFLLPPASSTTIVTDTAQQARDVAFGGGGGGGQRQKVVALDGTIINKAGIITGGMHSGLEARAGQWDQGAVDDLRQVRDATRAGVMPVCVWRGVMSVPQPSRGRCATDPAAALPDPLPPYPPPTPRSGTRRLPRRWRSCPRSASW